MFWTHIYDLLLKALTLILSIFFVISIPVLEEYRMITVPVTVGIAGLLYYLVFRTFATYLYCRFSLKMSVTLEQAKELNNAFSPFSYYWLPMDELKDLAVNNKYEIALEKYKKWKGIPAKPETIKTPTTASKKSIKTKILTVMMWVSTIYLFAAGLLNIFPATLLSDLYCSLLETDKYYPMLNAIVLAVPTLFFFKSLDKDID